MRTRHNVLVVAASGNDGDEPAVLSGEGEVGRRRSERRPPTAASATTRTSVSGLTLVAPGGGADKDLVADHPNCHPNAEAGPGHLPGDLRRRRITELPQVRSPVRLLRHLDGGTARQRDGGADHRERRAGAAPDGRRDRGASEVARRRRSASVRTHRTSTGWGSSTRRPRRRRSARPVPPARQARPAPPARPAQRERPARRNPSTRCG